MCLINIRFGNTYVSMNNPPPGKLQTLKETNKIKA